MAENVTRIRDSDVIARVTVLETQMYGVASSVEKIEGKMETQYQTLHSRISDLRDDINVIVETKNDKVLAKMDAQSAEATRQHKVMGERLSELEKWRWMLIGGALVVGYVLAHLKIEKLF